MNTALRPHCLISMFIALGLVACGSDEGAPAAPNQEGAIPRPSVNGLQIVTPEFSLRPGGESQSCYYTSLTNEEEVFVRQYDAFQASGGHHVILMSPLLDRPDGTVEDCTEGEQMVNYLPLVLSLELNHFTLDGGLGVRLPPRAKVVVQSHYVNPKAEAVSVRDVINLEFIPKGEPAIPVGFWASAYLNLAVPPMSRSTLKYRCTAEQDMKLLALIGHMHGEGSHLTIDIGSPGAAQRVYAVDSWTASFRDTPPQERWTTDAPLTVHAGDVMDVTCNWNSTSTETLKFPVEMCGSNAWFYPTDASITCSGVFVEGNAAGG